MRNYKPVNPTTDGSVIGFKTAMSGMYCHDSQIKYYNVDDIVHMLDTKAYKSLYEVYGKSEIKTEQYVKIFFDVDKSKYNKKGELVYPDFKREDFKDIHMNAINFIKNTFNCTDDDLVISESCNSNDGDTYNNCLKFSEHIVIRNKKSKIVTLYNWSIDLKNVLEKLYFDISVYPKEGGRQFRMVNTSKDKQNRPLNILNGDIHEHLITYVSNITDENIWNYTKVLSKSQIREQKKLVELKSTGINYINETTTGTNDLLALLNMLDVQKYGKYEDWIKILLIFKGNGGTFIDFDEWSKSVPNYVSSSDVQSIWNSSKPSGSLKINSLHYYAKRDNPNKYKSHFIDNCELLQYIAKNGNDNVLNLSDTNCSNLFIYILNNSNRKIVTTGIDEWFYFNQKWTDGKDIVFILFCETFIIPLLNSKLYLLSDTNETYVDMYNYTNSYLSFFEKTSRRNGIKSILFALLYDNTLLNKFDTNPYLLNCANGVYDFTTKTLRPEKFDDYLLKNTGINYINRASNDECVHNVLSVFRSVLPNSEELQYTLLTLASTLLGINPLEQIYMWQGSGRNGKSLLMLFVKSVLGNYAVIGHNCIIDANEQIDKSFMNNLKGARLVIFNEILKGTTLRTNMMKGLSGNDEQTTRELFKSSTTWKPTFKMFLLSNGDLNIDSIDEALWMRIQINKFKVWFKDDPNPNSPYEAQIDRSLKSILETSDYKEALLWLLIEFAKELVTEFKINVPTSILENNSNIRSSSDSYTKWFNETYYVNHEEMQLTEYLCINRQLKSLWEKYQRSTYFTKRKDTKSDLKRALEVLGLECIDQFKPYIIDELGNKKQHIYRSYFKGIMLCDE
jgi:phage/plasmid-associated DNA primase